MKNLKISISIFLLCSCSDINSLNSIVYYRYGDVVITRVNKDGELSLYYGKCTQDKPCKEEYIKTTFSGFNSGASAYLVFLPNKKVEFIRLSGWSEENMKNSFFRIKVFNENYELINWTDSIKGNWNNIVYISAALNIEKKLNIENNSKVDVTY